MEMSQMDGGGEMKVFCVCDGVQMAPTAKEEQRGNIPMICWVL